MHIVLTPAWYPDRARPHNGSFFRHQAQMLRRAGMRVGVLALEPVSFWQAGARLEADVEEGIVVVRGTIPTVPQGGSPGGPLHRTVGGAARSPALQRDAGDRGPPGTRACRAC